VLLQSVIFYKKIFIFLAFALLLGCTSTHSFVESQRVRTGAITPEDAPFELYIDEEFFDGTYLSVAFALRPTVDSPVSSFGSGLVLLRSMEGDKILDRSSFEFSELDLKRLVENKGDGAEENRVLQVRSHGAQDYQVEVLWGEDAERVKLLLVAEPLRLEDLQIDPLGLPCQDLPCLLTFRVEGLLINTSESLVDSIRLGVKYLAPEELSGSEVSFEQDQLLSLDGLILAPGQSRQVRVVLEEPLAIERFDAGVRPVIQIKDFRLRE